MPRPHQLDGAYLSATEADLAWFRGRLDDGVRLPPGARAGALDACLRSATVAAMAIARRSPASARWRAVREQALELRARLGGVAS